MALTQLTDVIIPEVFASYQVEDSVVSTAFAQSGVITNNPLMDQLANGPGQITTLPYWKPLDSSGEPNYSNDDPASEAVAEKVDADEQVARVCDLNNGFSAADLVGPLAGSDPMRHVANHLDQYWAEQAEKRVIATTLGVYNANVAQNSSDMVYDISLATGAVTADNQFSGSAFIGGAMTLGDMLNKIQAIAMHSAIYAGLIRKELISFLKDSQGQFTVPAYMGKRVIVDDGMPTVGTGVGANLQYLCALYGYGAFGYGRGTPRVPIEVQRYAQQGNGGGVELLWSRKRWVMHPFGYKFTSNTITAPGKSPTWADLKLAANWSRTVSRKNVPIAFLIVNA